MGLFGRKVELYPGLSAKDLARALHKDTASVRGQLANHLEPGEVLNTYFTCPADAKRAARVFAISNVAIWYIDEHKTPYKFLFEELAGVRLRAGYIRLGFFLEDDEDMSLLTEFIGGGPHECVAMWASIVTGWKRRMGREFPKDAFREAVPELRMIGDRP